MTYDLDTFDMTMMNTARQLMKSRWPEMVEGYLEDAHMYLDSIKAGFQYGDKNIVAANAHPLKSASHVLGVCSISNIAKTVEYETKDAIENDGNIDHIENLVPLIELALEKAEPKLRATIGDAA